MTPVQLRLLEFICGYQDEHGVSPTLAEMTDSLGRQAKSGMYAIILALQREGWITRSNAIQRDVVILRRPASRDPYAIDRLASLDPAKFEQLALNIVTLQARRAA